MDIKQEIFNRKKRWSSFMQRDGTVNNIYMVQALLNMLSKSYLTDGDYSKHIDWIVKKYNIMLESVEKIPDDSIPYLDMSTGTEIFAEAFGCRVVYPGNDMPFALPMIYSAAEIAKIKVPDMWNTRLAQLFEMGFNLRKQTDKEAVIRLPDIQSPLDIATLIMHKEEFFMTMLDEPEAIKELSEKVYILFTQFLDEWFKEFGRDFIAHYPDYYMEYGITLSEDEVGSVSPELFRELFLPELNRLSDKYGQIGMHCCADSERHWQDFKNIKKLRLLNLCRNLEIINKAYPFFADTCCQYHSCYAEGDISTWKSKINISSGIIFHFQVKNYTEANELLNKIKNYF